MIILMGIASEPPIRLLAEACQKHGLAYTFFNQREQDRWSVAYDPCNAEHAILGNGAVQVRVADCSGLYLRTMDPTKIPEWDRDRNKEKTREMFCQLWRLLDDDSSPMRVINVPAVQLSNNSKPYQSLVIQRHGLDIPDTCVSSDEQTVREFLAIHPAVVYKSISGTRSIVKLMDAKSLENLAKIRFCPVQFQERVSGFNVRVHVVGDQVIATRIRSDSIDYRYAAQDGNNVFLEPYVLSDQVAAKCVSLAHSLQLPFAGIDLMITDDGRTICFEVNPSPGYSYFQQCTGQPISNALANHLATRHPAMQPRISIQAPGDGAGGW